MFFKDWVDRFLVPIDDPGSRLFHVNLVFTILFVMAFILMKPSRKRTDSFFKIFRKFIFNKKYWWNSSTKLDYQIYFLNSFFKVFLFIPFLDFSFRFSQWTSSILLYLNNQEMLNKAPTTGSLFVFTLFAFIFDDFLRFVHHFTMHKIPWLWRWHQVHHSARILTPITLYRAHPLEAALAALRNSISIGVMLGFFIFIFSGQFSLFNIVGVNFFGFAFNLLASNLRHSHIPISFGVMEALFISPKQHQIHHSTQEKHFNKNFGVSLSLWDRCLGSLVSSDDVSETLKFGLSHNHRQTLKSQLLR